MPTRSFEQGDARGFEPYLKIMAALDRYHGLDAPVAAARMAAIEHAPSAPRPLALPVPSSPLSLSQAFPRERAAAGDVADFGA